MEQRHLLSIAAPLAPQPLTGTAGDDLFEFTGGPTPSNWEVRINGLPQFVSPTADGVRFDGLGGNDTVLLTGTEGADEAELRPDQGSLGGEGYVVTVLNVASIQVDMLGGDDLAILHDSAGDDLLTGSPGLVALAGPGFSQSVAGSETTHVYAKAGGVDVAKLVDSPGDDTFVGKPTFGKLWGDGFFIRAKFFEYIHAYARQGGFDEARLRGSSADDTFIGTPSFGKLFSSGHVQRAKFFEEVRAIAGAGGTDNAYLSDSPRIDHLQAAGNWAEVSNGDLGFLYQAAGFGFVRATGTTPGETKEIAGPLDFELDLRGTWAEPEPAGIVNRAITTDPGVQQMPSIAVDPLDADHLVVAYMDYSLVETGYAGIGVSVSRDRGQTWQAGSIPLPENFDEGAANPIVRFDDQGAVFVSFMAATFLGEKPPLTNPDFFNPARGASDRDRGMQANNGVFVASSDDGGVTWNQPAAVTSHLYDGQNDVPFEVVPDLAIDTFPALPDGQPNPNYGNMYVSWTRLYPAGQFPGEPGSTGGGDIMIAVSLDAGQSWETRLQDEDGLQVTVIRYPINFGTGPSPGLAIVDQSHLAIGPEGGVYVSSLFGGNFTVHYSTDAGTSFGIPNLEDGRRHVFGTDFDTSVSADGLPNNRFRTHAVRAIAADPTRPGDVYAVEPIRILDALGNEIDGADIFFGRSVDFGETWETTLVLGPNTTGILNDDNDGHSATGFGEDEVIAGQALARVVINAQGNIGGIWYDTRRDPADHLLDVFATISTDGGQTFSPNFRITDVSFDADEGSFTDATGGENFYLGDFIGLAMANNTGYAAWTDTRNGNQDIFFASHSIDPAPEPLNDRFEPNDTAEMTGTPTVLGRVVQRVLPKLAVPPGDEDWFLLQAAATGELIASVRYDDGIDLLPDPPRLELWDQTATTLLATGSDLLDEAGSVVGEEVRSPSDAGEAFLVRVVGSDAGQTVFYSLRLQSLTADLGRRVFASVDGTLTAGGGALYRVTSAAPGSVEVELAAGENVQGDLNLQILDPETFAVLASGEAPPGPSLRAPSVEPNDSIPQANPTGLVGPGSVTIDSFIGDGDFGGTAGDVDFFRFQAAASQSISVDVDPLAGGLDSMIALYDSGGNSLEMVDAGGPSDAESLSFVTQTAGTYFVAVMAFASGFPSDPFTPGTVAGAGTTGEFRVTITDEAVGAGAVKQGSLPVRQQGQTVLLLVSGENGSSGDFALKFTNLDQFTTQDNATLLFPAGAGPSELALGDLDADGNPDLVVSNALSNTISVLLGNGDGTFQAPRQSAVGAFGTPNPVKSAFPNFGRNVAIADFNRDTVPDLVVTNYDSSDVSVLLGRGDGTFEPQRRFDATQTPFTLDVGDLNGDTLLDLVVVDSNAGASTAAVLLGRGDGTFQPQRTFPAPVGDGFPETAVRIADLDGDGQSDLVMSGDNEPFVHILLGNGDGTFSPGGSFQVGRSGTGLVVTDLDGDGNLDVVTTGAPGIFTVSVLFGKGDGTFQDFQEFFAGQFPVDVAVVDFGSQVELPDGSISLGPPDGNPDLVVSASGVVVFQGVGPPEVVILPGIFDDQGKFVEFGSPQRIAPAKIPTSLDAADVNGDGAVDIAVVDVDGVLVIFTQPPDITLNTTPEAARNLGTVVHFVDQTQTIVPGREDAYYKLTVPTEAVAEAGDEIIDFSALIEATEGAGLGMEVRDAAGSVLGSGERFRVRARQGEELLLHLFGVEGDEGVRGSGAFTLVIDVLPQVVFVESQAFLPGVGENPGGATTNLVLTFQGDRLERTSAQNPDYYTVTYLGPDRQAGTADDRVIPIGGAEIEQPIVYGPGTNIEPTTGRTHATAVRQTVTLLFVDPLPAGSYVIELAPQIQSAAFNEEELGLLTNQPGFTGHPLVSVETGQIAEGSRVAAVDLVLESVELGNFSVFKQGTPFLTQLHDDLGAMLDAVLTERRDDPVITAALNDQVLARLEASLGPPEQRQTAVFALWLDPISGDIEDPDDELIDWGEDTYIDEDDEAYVDVDDNIDVIVDPYLVDDMINDEPLVWDLTVSDVSDTARGGVVFLSSEGSVVIELTEDLRAGVTSYSFSF